MNKGIKLLLLAVGLSLFIAWMRGAFDSPPSRSSHSSDLHETAGEPDDGSSEVSFGSSDVSKAEKERRASLIAHANYCRERALWAFRMDDPISAQSWLNQAAADERAAR